MISLLHSKSQRNQKCAKHVAENVFESSNSLNSQRKKCRCMSVNESTCINFVQLQITYIFYKNKFDLNESSQVLPQKLITIYDCYWFSGCIMYCILLFYSCNTSIWHLAFVLNFYFHFIILFWYARDFHYFLSIVSINLSINIIIK